MTERSITVALAGNPNSGKTTLFNALTGARQHVGNYPGVTVEKREGYAYADGARLVLVDLPGTYSLTALSEDEIVARNFLITEHPEVVVAVIDASNLERNLYLALQLLELDMKVVLVLNMHDIAQRNGMAIDVKRLSQLIGVPVVATVGHKKRGVSELKGTIVRADRDDMPFEPVPIRYGDDIEKHVTVVEATLTEQPALRRHARWLALKLLENDEAVVETVRRHVPADDPLWPALERSRDELARVYGDTPEILIADRRYGFISGLAAEVLTVGVEQRHDVSDQIDSIVTHPVAGLPIFLGLMYVVFYLTFTLGEWPMLGLEKGFDALAGFVDGTWVGEDNPLKSLLVDGVIRGVGGVIVFLPNILLLFFAIALLEDTGYMARAAFVMDRFMHKIGLHGKSFIPMVIGFGCSVPAIMATRILENRRDRLTTIMVVPLMSCGARLPIYSLLIPAFFVQRWRAPMLWVIYLIGIMLAVLAARVLRKTFFKGESTGLVIELPPYRMPTLRGLVIHMWQRGWMYVRKAGTIILPVSIVLWGMTAYPKPSAELLAQHTTAEAQQSAELQYSIAGRLGQAIEPVIKPIGFDWRIGTALVGALAAKEVFVAQMGIVFSVGDADEESDALREKLAATYTPLTAFCIMLFCLISAPCVATLATTRKETGRWGWALAQFGGLTVLAYVVSLIAYQVGSLMA